MRRGAIISGVLIVLVLPAFCADKKTTSPQKQKKSVSKSKSTRVQPEILRGCVDQRDGNYVLTDDRMLNKIADLQAVSGGQEANFAKHLGHKVTVKGNKSSEPDSNVFRVASIEEISEVCAPDQGAK